MNSTSLANALPENFIEAFNKETIRDEGKIYSGAENGRLPFISARDIAATGYRALADEKPHNTDHIITGAESLSYVEVRPLREIECDVHQALTDSRWRLS